MKIICIARNYAAHAEELDRQVGGGTPCPPEPAWFLKPDTALLRNNDPFYIPAFSQEVHYECELVVRINRVGKGIAERFAHRYYDQVGLGIDFTARDLQRQAIAEGLPWERCKAFDRSAALSPQFVSLQELGGDVQSLHFTLEVNGQTLTSRNLIIAAVIAVAIVYPGRLDDDLARGTRRLLERNPMDLPWFGQGNLAQGYLGGRRGRRRCARGRGACCGSGCCRRSRPGSCRVSCWLSVR